MTPLQQHHTIEWVELLLSGRYKHGKGALYSPTMDSYSALGLALVQYGQPRNDIGQFVLFDDKELNAIAHVRDYGGFLIASKTVVREDWFAKRFGLPKEAVVYTSIDSHSRNFYAVTSLILNACNNSSKQQRLWTKLHNLVDTKV